MKSSQSLDDFVEANYSNEYEAFLKEQASIYKEIQTLKHKLTNVNDAERMQIMTEIEANTQMLHTRNENFWCEMSERKNTLCPQ